MPRKASASPRRGATPRRSPREASAPGRSKSLSPSSPRRITSQGAFYVAFPRRSALDTLLLLVYLPLLGICAALRAIFWTLGVPLMLAPGGNGWDWGSHSAWDEDFGASSDKGVSVDGGIRVSNKSKEGLVKCLVERGAHRFPHSHGRPFAKHLAGVPALVAHWRQPQDLVLAALFHSAYSTEMFPWGLFSFRHRGTVQSLIGASSEHAVFLYCTVSQVGLYRQALSLSEIPPSGLPVTNCQTGQRALLPPPVAARVLVLLSADIMEQDPFFDAHLACSLLRLAAPHLDTPPLLAAVLQDAGFWDLSQKEHRAIAARARGLLRSKGRADLGALEDVWRRAPWLYEVGLEVVRRGGGGGGGEREVKMWSEAWGTAWSRLGTPREEEDAVAAALRER